MNIITKRDVPPPMASLTKTAKSRRSTDSIAQSLSGLLLLVDRVEMQHYAAVLNIRFLCRKLAGFENTGDLRDFAVFVRLAIGGGNLNCGRATVDIRQRQHNAERQYDEYEPVEPGWITIHWVSLRQPLRLIESAFRRDRLNGRLLNLDFYVVGDFQGRIKIADCSDLAEHSPCRNHLVAF